MNPFLLDNVIRAALDEDLSLAGDITTRAVVTEDTSARAAIVSHAAATIAGVAAAERVFRLLDHRIEVRREVGDGDRVEAGVVLVDLDGPAAPILTGERTAINLLSHLSGIATATAELTRLIEGTRARITDTRKTTPGLRMLEKWAVSLGGGVNHRFGLYDAALIKDNHIVAAGGIAAAVGRVRAQVGHTVKIEVEVEDLGQLQELLEVGADVVLLDNMDPPTLRRAVTLVGGRMITEASGNVTAATIREVAETGVDLISVGWITHSAPAVDISLDLI